MSGSTQSLLKRVKRLAMIRIRRPFLLVQIFLIALILYLAKRTRDKHRDLAKFDLRPQALQMASEPIDLEGGVELFEDSAQGRREEQEKAVSQPSPGPLIGANTSLGYALNEINQQVESRTIEQRQQADIADTAGVSVQLDEGQLEPIPRPAVMARLDPKRFSLEVTEEMLNSFSVRLPPLLPNYKNPCWEEELPDGFTYDDSFFNTCHYILHTNKLKHGAQFAAFERVLTNRTRYGIRTRIRCFPYFFLIGVGKCGTTDVFDTLKKYFWQLAPIFLKEPHYWEWKRCIDKLMCRGEHRTPTFAEYLDSFDPAADFVREKTVTGSDGQPYHPLVLGDFTPSTLAFHPCWRLMPSNRGLTEPRYINAHYIKALRPETKFITIMRDPVERVFSNFRMRDRMSVEQKYSDAMSFHEEMVKILDQLNDCMKTQTTRACAYSIMRFDFGTHVTNSMYAIFIEDWLKLFPRNQFLFLRMEDYMEDRVPHIRQITEFLEFEPMTPEQELMIGSKSVTNRAPPADMFNETRKLLQDFYRPFNRKLAQILADDKWTWGY